MSKLKENLTLRNFSSFLGIIVVVLGAVVLIWFLFFKDKGKKNHNKF